MRVCGLGNFLWMLIFFLEGWERLSHFPLSFPLYNFLSSDCLSVHILSSAGSITCLHVVGSYWHPFRTNSILGSYEFTFKVIQLVHNIKHTLIMGSLQINKGYLLTLNSIQNTPDISLHELHMLIYLCCKKIIVFLI